MKTSYTINIPYSSKKNAAWYELTPGDVVILKRLAKDSGMPLRYYIGGQLKRFIKSKV